MYVCTYGFVRVLGFWAGLFCAGLFCSGDLHAFGSGWLNGWMDGWMGLSSCCLVREEAGIQFALLCFLSAAFRYYAAWIHIPRFVSVYKYGACRLSRCYSLPLPIPSIDVYIHTVQEPHVYLQPPPNIHTYIPNPGSSRYLPTQTRTRARTSRETKKKMKSRM